MNDQLIQTIVKFLMRRGLTLLGGSAAELTDNDLAQFISIALVIANEVYQAYKAHQVDKAKAETVKIAG